MSKLGGTEEQKRAAARAALDLVTSDSILGIGSGSTVRHFIEELGARLASGSLRDVRAVVASCSSERLAAQAGVPLCELPADGLPLVIDGMDEVDDDLKAIKGLGGALAREKILAESAERFVLIGDAGKRVTTLAERTPVPVEILGFGWRRTARRLEALGLEPRARMQGGELFRSDNGNPILDCRVRLPADLARLGREIATVPGVIEHGLFLDMAQVAFIATDAGILELRRPA